MRYRPRLLMFILTAGITGTIVFLVGSASAQQQQQLLQQPRQQKKTAAANAKKASDAAKAAEGKAESALAQFPSSQAPPLRLRAGLRFGIEAIAPSGSPIRSRCH